VDGADLKVPSMREAKKRKSEKKHKKDSFVEKKRSAGEGGDLAGGKEGGGGVGDYRRFFQEKPEARVLEKTKSESILGKRRTREPLGASKKKRKEGGLGN